ncbi:MAG: amino acid adenylation domain-containing protein, partial [Actinophytocola sp.]|uniref:amino acid adenylation domain-containing protein n=1 Tax=Actinophytocola sp. TaxID=1872138 RepID=UPI003D6BADA1
TGLGPDDVVGILHERDADMVAALLGILSAGAAYLPLSSTHPPGYLETILGDAGARFVIAAPNLVHRLSGAGVTVVTPGELLEDDGAGTEVATAEPPARPGPENLAYVLFTSGSTGRPKGVAVTHRAVSNVAATMREVYRLTAADRVLQFANLGFDIAVEEMFPTWAAGGCVVLSPEPPPDPAGLTRLMNEERVSFSILTSGFWRQWVTDAWRRGIDPAPTLRLISIGAEPTDAATVRRWLEETGVGVFNAYGLTETTVNTTIARVAEPVSGDRVGIGGPLPGVDVFVLDDELEPVPPGVIGQLYAGGDCLARGYLGRPDLTAARFVPHPFGEPGTRLHRTGDRARWLADGSLQILGRVDEQLKVRGYRVEPGHIEAVLTSHAGVTAAAVTVRPDADGRERLVGYVVPAGGGGLPADLRSHVAARLPAYLVPSILSTVDTMPRNANGKVDVHALPEPIVPATRYTPPTTDLERTVHRIWLTVLDRSQVGVHDNFFECGGTSTSLALVLAALNRELELSLPLVTLYEFPTVAALAARLAGSEREDRHAGRADRLRAGRGRMAGRRRGQSG